MFIYLYDRVGHNNMIRLEDAQATMGKIARVCAGLKTGSVRTVARPAHGALAGERPVLRVEVTHRLLTALPGLPRQLAALGQAPIVTTSVKVAHKR